MLGVYGRPDRFRVENVAGRQALSALPWIVGDAGDLAFVRPMHKPLCPARPDFGLLDTLALIDAEPVLSRTYASAKRKSS